MYGAVHKLSRLKGEGVVKKCHVKLVKRQIRGEGVKHCRFWDDIVYGQPLKIHYWIGIICISILFPTILICSNINPFVIGQMFIFICKRNLLHLLHLPFGPETVVMCILNPFRQLRLIKHWKVETNFYAFTHICLDINSCLAEMLI